MLRLLYCALLCISSLFILNGCQLTAEQQAEFDPEKAALARLKLGLAYLAEADQSEENIKFAHYNLSLANQYSPNNPNVMLGMALFDQHVGEYKEAEIIYQTITTMEPNNGLYLIHYGAFLCATDRYIDAQEKFKKAISLNHAQWKIDSFEQLGYCAAQNGDRLQADEAFNSLFQYDSMKRKRVMDVAQLYKQKGDIQLADYLFNISKNK